MKKILFLFIFSLIIIYNINTEKVVYKEIVLDNIKINYPYFSKHNINNFINDYINKNIKNNKDNLIIDYDYNKDKKIITFYKTNINNNIINNKINTFKINKNNIYRINNLKKVDNYNFLNNEYYEENTKYIAFTFDDGPNYNTSAVIDILNKYNVTATFFVMGKNIKGNEKIIEKMKNSNMEIGNHTYNHLLLTKYNNEIIKEEINKTNELIFSITNTYPTLLRPSYGSVNKKIKNISDMPIVIWNIDTLDWKYKDSDRIANKILKNAKDGDIILMHDIYKSTLNSLDKVIPKLLENGFNIVTVSELFYHKNTNLEKGKVYGFAK